MTMRITKTFERLLDFRKYTDDNTLKPNQITINVSEINFNLMERIEQGLVDCYGGRCEIIIRRIDVED
jgi:hypothetical protein